jgi:type IX secretion system PorP/SprF family membrane protein
MIAYAFSCDGQQQTQFTQYMFNNLIINPAYAGADEALSLTLVNRRQWTGVKRAPQTQTLSMHTLANNKKMGMGVTIQNDRIGAHKNLSGFLVAAYHLRTGKHSSISMGLQAGFHNRKTDYTSLNGSSQDPLLNDLYISSTTFDVGAGIYFRNKNFQAGISSPAILGDKFQLNDTTTVTLAARNTFLYVSYMFEISNEVDLIPSILLKHYCGVPLGFDINANFLYRKLITMGLSYRNNESLDFIFKAKVTPLLTIGYAYDHPIGMVSRLSNGSHELMVNYLFKSKEKTISRTRR